jgi:hypothetical protein
MPLSKLERRRLSPEEDDWNLVRGSSSTLSRTRGNGQGRPNLDQGGREPDFVDVADASTNDGTTTSSLTQDEEEEAAPAIDASAGAIVVAKKPTHTRVILEVAHLEEAFQNYGCPECGEYLELKLRTVCIATSIELICNNKECSSYVCQFGRPSPTTIHDDQVRSYERMTDYAVNVIYALGFVSVGDGHTEAGRLLGLLGLPMTPQ